MIGASAAISGLTAAAIRFVFEAGGPMGVFRRRGRAAFAVPAVPLSDIFRSPQIVVFVAVWFGINFLYAFASYQGAAPIAWEAHIGGFIGGLLLFPVFGHVGVAASIAASAWVDFALLSTILYRRSWLRVDGHAVGRLARIIAATGTMACILIAATHALGDAIHGSSVTALALLLALVGLGAVSYFGSLHLLGVMTVKNLFLALRLKS